MLRGYERSLLTQPEVRITAAMRPVIELAIIEACARRDWRLLALNVRKQHIHVVIAGQALDQAMPALKAYATRRLRDEGLDPPGGKVWARGGSVGVLRTEAALCGAAHYVLRRQGVILAGSILAEQ